MVPDDALPKDGEIPIGRTGGQESPLPVGGRVSPPSAFQRTPRAFGQGSAVRHPRRWPARSKPHTSTTHQHRGCPKGGSWHSFSNTGLGIIWLMYHPSTV